MVHILIRYDLLDIAWEYRPIRSDIYYVIFILFITLSIYELIIFRAVRVDLDSVGDMCSGVSYLLIQTRLAVVSYYDQRKTYLI